MGIQVWDVLSNSQVASIVWAADSEQAAAKAVVEAAVATWKKKFPCSKVDDCTAVCLFLNKRHRQDAADSGLSYSSSWTLSFLFGAAYIEDAVV